MCLCMYAYFCVYIYLLRHISAILITVISHGYVLRPATSATRFCFSARFVHVHIIAHFGTCMYVFMYVCIYVLM